jgi:DNA ligase-1
MKNMFQRIPLISPILFKTLTFFLLIAVTFARTDELRPQVPILQLANTYYPEIPLQTYWISEKLDGVRAYWNGSQFISKQGNIYPAPKWFTEHFPSFELDGELWLGRAQFDALSGIVRKKVPIDNEWQKISYHVFDLPKNRNNFDVRLAHLIDYFAKETTPPWLKLIPQFKVKNEKELVSKLKEIENLKGEGLMLHKGSSLYHGGRDDDLLKLKSYQDAEAQVIAHLPGKGKYQNMLGAVLVKAVNHVQEGKHFKIGTGFSDLERAMPPEIGSIITYKYFGLTSKGLPRFASFIRVRERY